MAPPTRAQHGFAASVALLLIVAVILTSPFAQTRLEGTTAFLPVYATIVAINDMITAVMLLAVFSVHSSRAVLALAMAYLFTGLSVIPWVLTFPGAQSGTALLGAGLQTTATISAARLYGFPLFVLVYSVLKDRKAGGTPALRPVLGAIVGSVVAVAALVAGVTWLGVAGGDLLPRLMLSRAQTAPLWDKVLALGMLLSCVALAVLLVRRRSVLDIWLCVVLLATLLENLLLGVLSAGRLSVGWWAGRLYGLVAASIVLCVFLSEMTTLYAKLVHSVSSERRARDSRLMAMEALSASVAHEISQPLGSMVTNAEAAMRWLNRPTPDLDEANRALQRIVNDGNRAADVVANIRSVFRKGTTDRVPVSLNEAIGDVLVTMTSDLQHRRVVVTTGFAAGLPSILGNPVQIKQLIANLVTNGMEAMGAIGPDDRTLRVATSREGRFVRVAIEDSGEGLDPQHRTRIFETIFTTKPHGSGMGLVICRSIVEAHGGKIWLENGKRRGAVSKFTLPILS